MANPTPASGSSTVPPQTPLRNQNRKMNKVVNPTPASGSSPIPPQTPLRNQNRKRNKASRKRYISSSSEDDVFLPCKRLDMEQTDQPETLQMWHSVLEVISAENLEASAVKTPTTESSVVPPLAALINMSSNGNAKIEDFNFTAGQTGPVHMCEILGLQASEIAYTSPRKRHKAMDMLVRSTVFAILRHCLNQYLHETCMGCTLKAPGQSAHECLVWPKSVISRKLRIVCGKISFKSILHVVILIGYSLNCLVLTPRHVDQILILITKIGRSHNSLKTLNTLLRPVHEPFLNRVVHVIQKRKYQYFMQ
ncbi:uncharacterized protein LOC134403196 [Elgaria multicarinata webbii]|uniref:uncharacterized protein LOC134403196 n=1 Tax=Elgaria multicarinata webbii TaxID=159646 RepID=UPI002FCD0E52